MRSNTKLLRSGRLLLTTTATIVLLHGPPQNAFAQGCIAVRGGVCSMSHLHGGDGAPKQDRPWEMLTSYRWLHSDHHFRGGHDEGQLRYDRGNEVINDSHFIDLTLQYSFSPRYGASLTLPYVISDRSSLYEHDGTNRRSSQASGVADMRVSGFAWIWDPATATNGNLLLGLGLKAPTGDDNAQDDFYLPGGGSVRRAVDQSIQPGDGGWGVNFELQGYRRLFSRASAYVQASYLLNPQDVNQTSTRNARGPRGFTQEALLRPANAALLAKAQSLGYTGANDFEDFMSIGDQYLFRAGFSYNLIPRWGVALTLGGRMEGVPVEDLVGSSNGFRRPGYTISVEPGITLMKGRYSVAILAPVALERVREQSVADKRWSELTGVKQNGDAAFADYVITATIGVRF